MGTSKQTRGRQTAYAQGEMPVSAAAMAALSSRGGGGALVLSSVVTLRRRSHVAASAYSSSAFSSAALFPRLGHSRALLFPSPRISKKFLRLSCLAPLSQETGPLAAASVADEDGPAVGPARPTDAAAVASSESDPVREAAGLLDIRVGRVLRAWRHPEADSLYVEEVDVGEPEPRTICSGLVAYVRMEALQDARVLVLANLKPRNMRGVKSNGMLLAASDAAHESVELLVAPEGAASGERAWFGAKDDKQGQPEPATPNQVQKKKLWETVQPHLKTDENFVASLGVHPMRTSAGVVVCKSLKNARIS